MTDKRERVIFHCDCNSFFASVETLDHPEWASVPIAVTGDPESRHGIILAKNELAKKYGVQTAETIWSAKQKCPGLLCVPSHHRKYSEISKKINQIYLDYTDLVEPFSVDESYLDVTGSMALFGMTPRELADDIRERVKREIGITISVGVSFCKVFAKLGSDYKKPDATTVFDREAVERIAYALPVREMMFVGKKTAEHLTHMGIRTIGELARCEQATLRRALGEIGGTIWKYATGQDDEPVHSYYEKREVKSIGNGTTFRRDLYTKDEMHAGIVMLCDEVVWRLRNENKKCTVVQVTIRDPEFHTIQRQRKLDEPTWLQSDIISTALALVLENWKAGMRIRMLTVTVSGLVPPDMVSQQISLFDEQTATEHNERQEKLEAALLDIRRKKGIDSIYRGIYDERELGLSNRKTANAKDSDQKE
ncbi:MAG: DNA polymerase IV [Clostridia bacterium]|nr:DNA polymerase IV [Clostridia bacterium]